MSEPPAPPARVLCRATVEVISGGWRVTVVGLAPYEHVRRYDISEKDDNVAAREGLRRFAEEMEAPPPGE